MHGTMNVKPTMHSFTRICTGVEFGLSV